MIWCKLCKEQHVYTTYLCETCQRIKHIMNIYGSARVHEVLENVLVRNKEQQERKLKIELNKEKTKLVDMTTSVSHK